MKINRIISCLICATPLLAVPLSLTSCSVYTNCKNEFKPDYKQLNPTTYTLSQGLTEWFNKGKNTDDFVKQEILWCHSKAARSVKEGSTGVPHYTYKSTFSNYNLNVSYGKIASVDEHRLSYKLNADIESNDIYYYDDVEVGSGKCHYQLEWSCSNLRFDAMRDPNVPENSTKDYWLIKPVVYDGSKEWWSTIDFDEKESIVFNIRYIIEIYKDGVQKYGLEATEAATMAKGHSYETNLYKVLNFFCCFWSYSLDNCTIGD